jgi:hypothetical protein
VLTDESGAMSKLYYYYQLEGGDEEWKPVNADHGVAELSPTFVTVLALDTLIDADATREVLDGVKYLGPMYFDLDAENIEESINGAKALVAKLEELGLTDTDLEVYLSGKKGLHIIIPPSVFMDKVAPVTRLPAIYKEIAFKLAVDTVDFKVYTARKGRMLRTCYNVRENGKYRVQISLEELDSLTAETYATLASAKRPGQPTAPVYRANMALIYDSAAQKIAQYRRKRAKPVTRELLQKGLPVVKQILAAENLADIGFNKVAIQLCIYAREAHWTEDQLVAQAAELLNNWQSDGSRYHTPWLRERELRRMFNYIDDNAGYDYNHESLKGCIEQPRNIVIDENGEAVESIDDIMLGGVQVLGNCYAMQKDDSDIPISNFVFKDVEKLVCINDDSIVAIRATAKGKPLSLSPTSFTGSAGLQNTLARHGLTFTGTDTHARGILQIMLKEVKKDKYIVDSEGLNYLHLRNHSDPEVASTPFLAWADGKGVRMPGWLRDKNVDIMFQGFPEEQGVIQSDLSAAKSMKEFLLSPRAAIMVEDCFTAMFHSNQSDVVALTLGWMVAAHWKPVIHSIHGKFPLLYVYGPAGMGKTEWVTILLKLFYLNVEPKSTTPSSTPFALTTLITGSSSIPVMFDEWKPQVMNTQLVEKYKGILRDTYNSKETQRGGGNAKSESFAALSKAKMTAPLVFMSEAVDDEAAILDRCVVVPLRRTGKVQSMNTLRSFLEFKRQSSTLSVMGKALAAATLQEGAFEAAAKDFDKCLEKVVDAYVMSPGDEEDFHAGKMTNIAWRRKCMNISPRAMHNIATVLFGLNRLSALLEYILKDAYAPRYKNWFAEFEKAAIASLDTSMRMIPEYIKVLSVMSDMSRLKPVAGAAKPLTLAHDYLMAYEGRTYLCLAVRFAYNSYRVYQKWAGYTPLYPSEASFTQALTEIPAYVRTIEGCAALGTRTILLDMDDLVSRGVPAFSGKPVPLSSIK